MPRFGCHVSVAGGMRLAVERAQRTGCEAFQVFTRNPNQWRSKPLDAQDVRAFRARLAASRIAPVVSHASYLINLAAAEPALRAASLEALGDELDRAAALGLLGVVVHPGASRGSDTGEALARVAAALEALLQARPRRRTLVLLENTAGQGTCLGRSFDELAAILEFANGHPRLGVCLDTCHLVAAGHDLASPAGYRATFERFERQVGLDRLHLFHVNDSRAALGSRVDRHAHVGQGHVGLEGFRRLVHDRRFATLPMLLETPKQEGRSGLSLEPDALDLQNLGRLRGLVHGGSRRRRLTERSALRARSRS